MRLNIDRDQVKQLVSGQLPNKSRHLYELTHEPSIWQCDTGQWLSCFDSCQLTILWMANVKDVDLPRHTWDTPPFLLIVSPTTYAWWVMWQPNEKTLTIFYEYGALSHAQFARERAPLSSVRHSVSSLILCISGIYGHCASNGSQLVLEPIRHVVSGQSRVSYSPHELKAIRTSRLRTRLPTEVWECIISLGIQKPKRSKGEILRDPGSVVCRTLGHG